MEAKASRADLERIALHPEPVGDGVMIEALTPSGMNAATTITSGKSDYERLPGQRNAPIDELDLEHALPDPPQQEPLEPAAQPSGAPDRLHDHRRRRRRRAQHASFLRRRRS